MSYALHGGVLFDSIQQLAQFSGIPPITSFGGNFEMNLMPRTRLCDIAMKNQALYFFF
jgi:hypothetical protein